MLEKQMEKPWLRLGLILAGVGIFMLSMQSVDSSRLSAAATLDPALPQEIGAVALDPQA